MYLVVILTLLWMLCQTVSARAIVGMVNVEWDPNSKDFIAGGPFHLPIKMGQSLQIMCPGRSTIDFYLVDEQDFNDCVVQMTDTTLGSCGSTSLRQSIVPGGRVNWAVGTYYVIGKTRNSDSPLHDCRSRNLKMAMTVHNSETVRRDDRLPKSLDVQYPPSSTLPDRRYPAHPMASVVYDNQVRHMELGSYGSAYSSTLTVSRQISENHRMYPVVAVKMVPDPRGPPFELLNAAMIRSRSGELFHPFIANSSLSSFTVACSIPSLLLVILSYTFLLL